jgi:hypothetical protein
VFKPPAPERGSLCPSLPVRSHHRLSERHPQKALSIIAFLPLFDFATPFYNQTHPVSNAIAARNTVTSDPLAQKTRKSTLCAFRGGKKLRISVFFEQITP